MNRGLTAPIPIPAFINQHVHPTTSTTPHVALWALRNLLGIPL